MLAQCYGRRGHVLTRRGKSGEAEKDYRISLDYCERAQNYRVAAVTLRYLGDLRRSQKRYGESMNFYSSAMDIAIDGRFVGEQIELAKAFASLYLRLGSIP